MVQAVGEFKHRPKIYRLLFFSIYLILFLLGIRPLLHGFPDIERFFAEWSDERLALSIIMKFGTLNFAPSEVFHPPLYHYVTFIPIAVFYIVGKVLGFFHDKVEFVRFYFNNTHHFFFIGRMVSYLSFWLSAVVVFRITRMFFDKLVSYITLLAYLMIPMFIPYASTVEPETLFFLNTAVFFYFFLRYYLDNKNKKCLYLSAFFLGISIATKYNAVLLGSIYLPFLIVYFKRSTLQEKTYKDFIKLSFMLGFLSFLGFFICNPFFIIKFSTYFYNMLMYGMVEARYYWEGPDAVFMLSHLKELSSTLYINSFGLLILFFGAWQLFKREKLLWGYMFFTIFVCEVYFSIYQTILSPLRYLNPLLPMAALIFSAGIDFIVRKRKKLSPILIIFGLILIYNYFDMWHGISARPTYIQKARSYIEKNVPEFTKICIAARSRLPQLNMTRESYFHLLDTSSYVIKNIKGHELSYKNMDDKKEKGDVLRELRVESLMKNPQYNIIRWDETIKTKKEAVKFFAEKDIEYLISIEPFMIESKKIEDVGIATLVKIFEPRNRRALGGYDPYPYNVYLYKLDYKG